MSSHFDYLFCDSKKLAFCDVSPMTSKLLGVALDKEGRVNRDRWDRCDRCDRASNVRQKVRLLIAWGCSCWVTSFYQFPWRELLELSIKIPFGLFKMKGGPMRFTIWAPICYLHFNLLNWLQASCEVFMISGNLWQVTGSFLRFKHEWCRFASVLLKIFLGKQRHLFFKSPWKTPRV